ncbi:Lrp/AsnC family transcriptional regulator [Ktedonobacter racemifer]|uniref:Transcriptional regulator, AsnC family n=1 Tax=Ktedonobacter racemifer DSM 44963 TaxID=485913 RepID=D6TS82_KTERA|nr:Lrp/AsnC family transcriptional regulator [Ktedonobacter racemifer]EFH83283.1 transcriptional regulator, AsnC family [Ktedonobacter racemifer DSM 44963]
MPKESRGELDQIDREIVRLLEKDARLSFAALGRKVHLSLSAVAERVRKLEDTGVVTGYHAAIDATKVGLGVQAILRIAADKEHCQRVAALAEQTPEVREGYQITGEDSYVLIIAVRSVEHLGQIVKNFGELGEVSTSVILGRVGPKAQ